MTTPNTTKYTKVDSVNYMLVSGVPGAEGATLRQKTFVLGTFICNGSTPVTVVEPNVTANSAVFPTLKTVGGTVGAIPAIQTITPGTGFTIAGTASDTSTYNYFVYD